MEERKPIKRSKELVALSRDHHDGLLLCWKIRTGIAKGVTMDRIANYVLHFCSQSLSHHFGLEEQYIFTLLPADNIERIKAEQEHANIRHQINLLHKDIINKETALNDLSNALEAHIRFEERILFPMIENITEETLLKNAGEKINEYANKKEIAWEDTFWTKN